MKKIKGLIVLLIISLTLFSSCTGSEEPSDTPSQKSESTTVNALGYEQITAEQAKEIMDTENDFTIIDSRTEEEFNEGHIEGAILIPEYEIDVRAKKDLPDKDQLILVYCRSGRRSKIASQALADSGYTNVKEFGGIIDWPYEIVK